jgi:hypothetical protein
VTAIPKTTATKKIDQVQGLMAKAELVRVSYGADGRHPSSNIPGMRIIVRGGNPSLTENLRSVTPDNLSEFPPLRTGEFELEFGDGYQYARISNVSTLSTVLQGNSEDPRFQSWLERQVDKIRLRTKFLKKEHALQWTAVGGQGETTQWTAIFEPEKLGMGSPQREAVATPGV